jgi:alanine racemase
MVAGEAAAVVKADAYGLGAEKIAPALAAAGCGTFFVALIDEGVALRIFLGGGGEAVIYVLGGLFPGAEDLFAEHALRPVLNSLPEIHAWAAFCSARDEKLPAAVHIDTGMSRLGLPGRELAALIDDPQPLRAFTISLVLSHLACAEDADDPKNAEQLAAFNKATQSFGAAKRSLANSPGIFLGAEYHFDLVRPGVAIYGSNPTPGKSNPMAQVVSLQGKIIQVRDVDSPRTVGYGATHIAAPGTKIATVAVGYADGYLRSLSNQACGYVGDVRAPLVGRVSMDLITFDVSAVAADAARPGAFIDLIGPHGDIDTLARQAGTIGYEILTLLGRRYHRRYIGG